MASKVCDSCKLYPTVSVRKALLRQTRSVDDGVEGTWADFLAPSRDDHTCSPSLNKTLPNGPPLIRLYSSTCRQRRKIHRIRLSSTDNTRPLVKGK